MSSTYAQVFKQVLPDGLPYGFWACLLSSYNYVCQFLATNILVYIFYFYWYSREPRLIQSLALKLFLGNYFNDEFSDFLFCFVLFVIQNWFSNLIRFRGANYSEFNRKGSTGSPWHNVAIDIHKISPSDTPNQILI